MKTIHLLSLVAVLLLPLAAAPPAEAREVVLSWDANPPEDKVAGYVLYIQKDGAWETLTDTEGLEATVNLPEGSSIVTVAARNAQGFTGPKAVPLEVLALPGAPAGLKMRITIELESK